MGKQWETVKGFIFLVSKIIADGECSHEIKRCLLLGRKAMTNLDSILKSRHYFANKAMVFPVVMYGCESWTIKKAQCQRIDAFELWCWRGLLRVSWTARKSNQDWCWGWSFNTLATWCEELTYWKRTWCWERLKARGEGDDRGWDGWMASLTQWTWVWASSRRWWRTRKSGALQSLGSQGVGHIEQLNNNKSNCSSTICWIGVFPPLNCLENWKMDWSFMCGSISDGPLYTNNLSPCGNHTALVTVGLWWGCPPILNFFKAALVVQGKIYK